MNETTPTPSRRRGRPPKIKLPAPTISTLAPPQGPAEQVEPTSVSAAPDPVVPTVPIPLPQTPLPAPLPPITADDVDLREHPRVIQSQALPAIHPSPTIPEPTVLALPEKMDVSPPAVPVLSTWAPITPNDVVQINNPQNKLFGSLFIVGDIKSNRVHGYQLLAGGKHEYITVNEDECFPIGPSKVRSRNGCSAKWIADNR